MSKMDSTNIIEEFPQKKPVYDSVKNFYYEMVRRDGGFYQREYRVGKRGQLLHERFVEAQYIIGSGNNLRMYFYNEHGMLYQLPLTWYVHKKQWDLSPGYREFGNLRFSRYAKAKCISCHNSYLQEVRNAKDRYAEPFVLGVGCERCHGPGELHVREKTGDIHDGLPPDVRTIVNPRKLSPQRQLEVCQQCHLQGKAWALKEEGNWFGYRPGTPLESHRSVYYEAVTSKKVFEVADSPHRLAQSRCFKESQGELTCITCHDPHRSIKTFSRDSYNEKCLTCHLPENITKQTLQVHTVKDDCISCHMNRTGTDNTLHGVSNTDHWIRRDANKTRIDWAILRQLPAAQPLVAIVPDVDSKDAESNLRQGIAYFEFYTEQDNRSQYLDSALHYVQGSILNSDHSWRPWYYLAAVQLEGRQLEAGLRSCDQSILLNQHSADVYFLKARILTEMKRTDSALEAYRKASELKPGAPEYLEAIGMLLAEKGETTEAISILDSSLRIDRQNPNVYSYLGVLWAKDQQDPGNALSYLQQALILDPDIHNGFVNLGNTYMLLSDRRNALKAYKRAVLAEPNSIEALFNLGRLYLLLADKPRAADLFRRVLKVDPSFDLARQQLNELQ